MNAPQGFESLRVRHFLSKPMVQSLLLSVKDAMVRYSEVPVFENLAFNIHERSRIALVGKNGTGKTTLMNIITGVQV